MKLEVKQIDAENKTIGRVASEAASILMGKKNPDFQKNEIAKVRVEIKNVSRANMPDKKLKQKIYHHFSGYPGGFKTESLERIAEKKGFKEVFRKAVFGMLPSNKLRSRIIKNLTITE